MIYVILGMHKSGTTLVSQILHKSGVEMGESFNDSVSYETGHKYERESTWRLNEDILGAKDSHSIRIRPKSGVTLDEFHQSKMKSIISKIEAKGEDWGFKDPRTCLTYSDWLPYLPPHKLVVVYRQPEASWHRYRSKRRVYRRPLEALRFFSSWRMHNEAILNVLAKTKYDYLVLEYNSLMSGCAEFQRFEQFTGLSLTDSRQMDRVKTHLPTYPLLVLLRFFLKISGKRTIEMISSDLESYRNPENSI